jgi:ABC-type nitrate/sulfonate/bicarbonate transport system substrate-binding protein
MTSAPRLGHAMRAIASLTAAAVIGCANPAPTTRPIIRVAYSGHSDVEDLSSLVAHAALEAEGYTIEETFFALSELSAEALARGNVEFAAGSVRSFWAAAGRGARIRTVMEHVANMHRLVVDSRITKCAGLDGRRVAIQSEGAAGTVLARAYFAEECPNVRPQTLSVPQSENRAAALLSGNLDAAVLELSMFLWLDQQVPGRFRALEDFAARWPLIKVTGVHVNTDFAAAHPNAVRDYVRARVLANRAVLADPSLLVAEATRTIGESAAWPAVVRAYVGMTAWAPDGGLTAADVERSLAFFQQPGGLKADLTVATVADLSVLTAVLADPRVTSSNAPGGR